MTTEGVDGLYLLHNTLIKASLHEGEYSWYVHVLDQTDSELYSEKGEDEEEMRVFFKEFSFPGGIGRHPPSAAHSGVGHALDRARSDK